jgi:hypothetical protein
MLADGGAPAFAALAPMSFVLADGGAPAFDAPAFASAVRAFLLWLLLLPPPLRLRCCWWPLLATAPSFSASANPTAKRCWPLLATAPSFSASASLTAKRRDLDLLLDVLPASPALVGLGHAETSATSVF